MKLALAALATVVFALLLGARLGMAHRGDGITFTARQVQAGILRHPDRWLGRTVLVRGVVASEGVLYAPATAATRYALGAPGGGPALAWSMQAVPTDLSEPAVPDLQAALTVNQGAGDDGWFGGLVRRLPLLDRLLPEHRAAGRRPATYRVALSDASADPGCAARVCYRAELLDPASQL